MNRMKNHREKGPRKVTAISGPMFADKTNEMIHRLELASFAKLTVQAFKWTGDTRSAADEIEGHNGVRYPAISVDKARDIFQHLKTGVRIIGIDEAQFLDEETPFVVQELSQSGIGVILTGLPTDFRGEPFGCFPILEAQAHKVHRRFAICSYEVSLGEICGKKATQTQRFKDGEPADFDDKVIVVGAEEQYQAVCPLHHRVPGHPRLRMWC